MKRISSKGHPYYYNVLTGESTWYSPTSIKGGGGMLSTPKLEPQFEQDEEPQFEEPQSEQDENPEEAKIASDLSDELLCPLSYAFIVDPVFLSSGRTYERQSIISYFESQMEMNGRDIQLECPATKTPVTNILTPNIQIRSMTDKFVEKYKDIKYIGPTWTEIRRLCSDYLKEQKPEKVEERKRQNKQIEEANKLLENRERRRQPNERLRNEERFIEQRRNERLIEQRRNEERLIEQRRNERFIEQRRNEDRLIEQRRNEDRRNQEPPEERARIAILRAREHGIKQEALRRPADRMMLQVPRPPDVPLDVYERIRISREQQDIYYEQDPTTTHERFKKDLELYLRSIYS